ncbi:MULTISPECIES: rod shape-determining protein MreC [Bacillus]|nr:MULTISPECIES: rod shape-determining protein MreC [Bacillus cereus group]ACK93833.1 rod shape-determining protein MreC [Bacillus cereus G9842]EJR10028.1 rod shape-determining protein MreC [Bacillus cereus MSX-A1]MBJ7961986.1 rod shape-determining protein MreC [Bacillus cereus]MBJ8002384.1 rod shape-determining protein MreC [Bacillus cereus]MCU5406362.1 rod shape-determining protein MreC [Bacillus cereus]
MQVSKKKILLFLSIILLALLAVYVCTNNKHVQNIVHNIEDIYKVYKENQALKGKIEHQESLKGKVQMLSEEKENLTKLINKTKELKEQGKYNLIQATVVRREAEDWYGKISLERGAQHGVKVGMAVITVNGFIGKVDSVDQYTSVVKLITSDERTNRLAITLQNNSSILGFVTGYDKKKQALRIDNIPSDKVKEIKIGDSIITSELSQKIPPGLEVAEVLEQEQDQYGLTYTIYAKPKANLYDLEYVILIQPK